jgi:hypothetical protein
VAKHQLIISEEIDEEYPVRSEAGQFQNVRALVVNWKGKWAPFDSPEQYLVVAPGDELELVLSSKKRKGGSLWLYKQDSLLLMPTEETESQDAWERVDIKSGSTVLEVNRSLARDSGEARYYLRISALKKKPQPLRPPPVGQGMTGTLPATKP